MLVNQMKKLIKVNSFVMKQENNRQQDEARSL